METVVFILCVCILTTRCCLWKDPSAVPRMGCAWSFCRKYYQLTFLQNHVRFFIWGVTVASLCFPSWHWGLLRPIRVSALPWCPKRATSWRAASPAACTETWECICQPWKGIWPSSMSCMKNTTWSLTKWCEGWDRVMKPPPGRAEPCKGRAEDGDGKRRMQQVHLKHMWSVSVSCASVTLFQWFLESETARGQIWVILPVFWILLQATQELHYGLTSCSLWVLFKRPLMMCLGERRLMPIHTPTILIHSGTRF